MDKTVQVQFPWTQRRRAGKKHENWNALICLIFNISNSNSSNYLTSSTLRLDFLLFAPLSITRRSQERPMKIIQIFFFSFRLDVVGCCAVTAAAYIKRDFGLEQKNRCWIKSSLSCECDARAIDRVVTTWAIAADDWRRCAPFHRPVGLLLVIMCRKKPPINEYETHNRRLSKFRSP